ncbi:MAG: hypothetical protein JWM08_2523 [Candidatus Angelobacter sp.]|nr:hypothetical protein [Candidatus Angelobacter sp.]MCU1333531.1 hypothetical protein [Candidatus Angelobacter sp.]
MAHITPMSESEQLLHALRQCGDQLDAWISKSPANVCLFIEDPMAAVEAATAPADLDLAVMLELEAVLVGLAQKLDLPVTMRIEADLGKAS